MRQNKNAVTAQIFCREELHEDTNVNTVSASESTIASHNNQYRIQSLDGLVDKTAQVLDDGRLCDVWVSHTDGVEKVPFGTGVVI
jgi:GMP synthase-like glutamine amidotransferase